MLLRDTSLTGIEATDGRALEIVATGLPLEHGIPLGCDATLVSPLHADGTPWPAADVTPGVALARAAALPWGRTEVPLPPVGQSRHSKNVLPSIGPADSPAAILSCCAATTTGWVRA